MDRKEHSNYENELEKKQKGELAFFNDIEKEVEKCVGRG